MIALIRNWMASHGEAMHWFLWFLSLALFLFAVYCVANSIIRRALGQTKYRGTWYSEKRMQVLLVMMYQDAQSGHRVMSREEMRLLRKHRLGTTDRIDPDAY